MCATGVAYFILNNPPANVYYEDMMRELDDAIRAFRRDASAHVGVVIGAGDRMFCGGADITQLLGADPTWKYMFCLESNETLMRLEHTPKLVIAALNGHAVGGGLEIAMACDLRIAWQKPEGQKPGMVGLPEHSLGILPGDGGTQRLPKLIGKGRAMSMIAESKLIGFQEALDIGLVNKLIEAEDLEGFLAAIHAYALGFCPPNKASGAVGAGKLAVQVALDAPFWVGQRVERELQQGLFRSPDAHEGLIAYVEKRRPNFQG